MHETANNYSGLTISDRDFSDKDLTRAIFSDANLYRCNFKNANLMDITAHRTHFMQCDFTDASLRNAYLHKSRFTLSTFSNTDLWDTRGDGKYVITLQLGGFNVCYTSEIVQVNCMQFDIKKIWWMSDEEVFADIWGHKDREMDNIAEWWTKWKYQIYQIVNNYPARPINSPK